VKLLQRVENSKKKGGKGKKGILGGVYSLINADFLEGGGRDRNRLGKSKGQNQKNLGKRWCFERPLVAGGGSGRGAVLGNGTGGMTVRALRGGGGGGVLKRHEGGKGE